jgi:hypothetical protein
MTENKTEISLADYLKIKIALIKQEIKLKKTDILYIQEIINRLDRLRNEMEK